MSLHYCLMTNPVHLVVLPHAADSLTGMLKPLHLRYAQHVNRTHGLYRRLWQERFFLCGLDETHLQSAVRYVERNPVRAGMAKRAEEYPWSSAAAHCGLRCESWLAAIPALSEQVDDWPAWLRYKDEDAAAAALRRTPPRAFR